MPSCPFKRRLPFLGTDAFGDTSYAAIELHVENCPDCKAALEDLAHPWTEPPIVLLGPEQLPRIPGFEIQCELGRGAMGIVYLAVQTGLDRLVALKVLPGAIGTEALPVARRRWLREARAVSSIRHPNVVPLYDYGEADGWFFLVLEYIPGGTLKKRLTKPIPPRVAAGLVETTARAVAYIHGLGLLHLDLKPSNILLDCEANAPWDRMTPRVSDFGLAVFDNPDASETSLAGPRGTPSYMAPEQTAALRTKIGPATDIYALGAILFELLTGRPPFEGTSTFDTLKQVCDNNPVPPRWLNPAIPRDLEIICLTCLEKDPGRRYASAEALTGDLRRWLDGHPNSARPVSSLEKTWRWCRRRPAIASLIAALALILASGFVGFFALWRYSEAERARAEVERARAEAASQLSEENELLASRSLNEISRVLYFALEHPESLSEDSMLALTYFLRKQASNLRNSRGVGSWNLPGLGVLERIFAVRLFSRGKKAEARSLLMNSVACLKECRRLDPGDERILWQLVQSLLHSGQFAADESAVDDSLAFYDQAWSLLGALRAVTYRLELLNELYLAKRGLLIQLVGRGESERAQRAMEANLRMFLSMGDTITYNPALILRKEWISGDRAPADEAIERLRSALRKFPDARNLRKEARRYIENRISLAVVPSSPDINLSGSMRYEDDPEAWAELLVSSFRSQCIALGLDESEVPVVAFEMVDPVRSAAVVQRKIGRLRDADLTVGRLLAFARRLVRNYPGHPESHMILSEAYFQVSKNAWKRTDYTAIERALRQALESARHAVRLNPQREDAQHFVDRLLPRLLQFDTRRSKP